jgi:hypothetical protein
MKGGLLGLRGRRRTYSKSPCKKIQPFKKKYFHTLLLYKHLGFGDLARVVLPQGAEIHEINNLVV